MDNQNKAVTLEDLHGEIFEWEREVPIQDQGGVFDKYTTNDHYKERGIY